MTALKQPTARSHRGPERFPRLSARRVRGLETGRSITDEAVRGLASCAADQKDVLRLIPVIGLNGLSTAHPFN